VGGTIQSTITGVYGGASASAELSVTAPTTATASFGVTGPSQTDTCGMANGGNTLDCTFNGSTSTAPAAITAWDWSYIGATTLAQTTAGPQLTLPTVSCAWLPPPPLPIGSSWLTITVTLVVHDALGNISAPAINGGVRVFPQGVCGY
jgi:hypothetical protein